MIDTLKQFEDSLPSLLEDNSLNEVLAAIAEHLDREAMRPEIDEASEHYKDLMLSSDILNAAAAGTNLDYGWLGGMITPQDRRKKALTNLKKQCKIIKEYDYS